MRRFLIFALLGPPLGLVTAMSVLLPTFNSLSGDVSQFDPHQIVLLPAAYFMGLVPALLAASFDLAVARRGSRWRPLWTGIAGFAASFIPLAAAILMGFLASPYVLVWGLIGAIPAAICSWLSSRKM